MDNAIKDIELFKKQKVRDLKDAMISYILLQIKVCKKVNILFGHFIFETNLVYICILFFVIFFPGYKCMDQHQGLFGANVRRLQFKSIIFFNSGRLAMEYNNK